MVASSEGIVAPVLVHSLLDLRVINLLSMDERELTQDLLDHRHAGWSNVDFLLVGHGVAVISCLFDASSTFNVFKFFGEVLLQN